MRLTLRKQITTALVLFGVVPASIVAAFAFRSMTITRTSRRILIRQAAASIATHLRPEFGDPSSRTSRRGRALTFRRERAAR